MEVKTKCSLNHKVFFLEDNKVKSATVKGIFIRVNNNGIKIDYDLSILGHRSESKVFKTKEELLESL